MDTPGGASRTTKDQGLYNKPSAAVHPGALAAGTLPQYNNLSNIKIHEYPFNGSRVVSSVQTDGRRGKKAISLHFQQRYSRKQRDTGHFV